MSSRRRQAPIPGWVGWLLTAGLIALWDFHPDTQTMSGAFCPVGRKYGKPAYVLVWAFLTAHLTRALPEQYDPLRRLDLLPWKIPSTGGTR